MKAKTLLFFLGCINVIEGFLGILSGKIYVRHWHEVSTFESLIWISSGILLIYFSKKIDKTQIEYSKCPKCKETFNYYELENGKCKYCKDVDTIDIEEYYEKYPDERQS